MFRPEKRAAIEQAVTSGCYASVASAVTSLGTIAADFYDPDFAARVSDCAGFDSGCDDELAARWFARFRADRPPLDDAGAPVLFWHGGADVTIPPGRARCAIDKVTAEMGTRATICGDPDADHGTIVPQAMPFVSSWLGARLLGEPEPAACAGIEALGPGADVCAMPPPNVD
jgi:pimeloyl-ACP methyl ester carboxylesterase